MKLPFFFWLFLTSHPFPIWGTNKTELISKVTVGLESTKKEREGEAPLRKEGRKEEGRKESISFLQSQEWPRVQMSCPLRQNRNSQEHLLSLIGNTFVEQHPTPAADPPPPLPQGFNSISEASLRSAQTDIASNLYLSFLYFKQMLLKIFCSWLPKDSWDNQSIYGRRRNISARTLILNWKWSYKRHEQDFVAYNNVCSKNLLVFYTSSFILRQL